MKILPAIVVSLLISLNVVGATFPARQSPHLTDEAGLLDASTAQEVQQKLRGLKQRQGIEFTVVTLRSLADYGETPGNWESYATRLFNHWRLGHAQRNDGLMLLVSKSDRKVRVEVGSGYGRRLDASLKRIIDARITPHFRAGQFGTEILSTVDGVIGLVSPRGTAPPPMTAEAPEGSLPQVKQELPQLPRPPPQPPNQTAGLKSSESPPVERDSGSFSLGLIVILLGVPVIGLLAVAWLVTRLIKGGKPRCASCAREMVLLTEQEEDPFLESGQKLEEAMGSVDYRVWRCQGCAQTRIIPHKRWFSGVEQCPGCQHRTVKRTTRMLLGHLQQQRQQLILRDCSHCGFHDERTVTLPQASPTDHLTASSFASSSSFSDSGSGFSSSSSSDSGGSSSGGGASGSW